MILCQGCLLWIGMEVTTKLRAGFNTVTLTCSRRYQDLEKEFPEEKEISTFVSVVAPMLARQWDCEANR